jgi:glyoxylate reductase
MRIFVTRTIAEAGLQAVQKAATHLSADVEVWQEDRPIPREILLESVGGVSGLVCLLTERIDTELIETAGPQLRVISQMAVGVDNIDLPAATAHGIPIGNTPGVLTESTADMAFALMLSAARRLPEGDRFVRAGQWRTWSPKLLLGHDIRGAVLGIVGFGRIGQAVARRAVGFGMQIVYHSRRPVPEAAALVNGRYASLEQLLHGSDFVSLNCALTPATQGLIGARELSLMKPGAILVNTARGGVVDSVALYEALKAGTIAGAALDVTDPEPISANDALLSLDNCLIVPHIASATVATRAKMALMAADNLAAGLTGERLPNCANPEVYESFPPKGLAGRP